jgi:hypothetical protein
MKDALFDSDSNSSLDKVISLTDRLIFKFIKEIESKHQKEKDIIKNLLQEFSDLYDVTDTNDIRNEQVYKNIQVLYHNFKLI